jgi:hypothetical protein
MMIINLLLGCTTSSIEMPDISPEHGRDGKRSTCHAPLENQIWMGLRTAKLTMPPLPLIWAATQYLDPLY